MRRHFYRLFQKFKRVQYWLIAQLTFGGLAVLRLLPHERATKFAAITARKLGPLTPRHKIAIDNLRQAFPEKSDKEHEEIAGQMWANMARLFAEYVFLDQLMDYEPDATEPGRIEVEGRERFVQLLDSEKPVIFFTAHIGNFELLPVCAATFGLDVTALFRSPNNPYIARKVLGARTTAMGKLVPSKAGAAWALGGVLDRGGNVGVLVDQKFSRGIETSFFGRSCKTSPLLVKLARQYDCDIYPAHSIRLSGSRYKLTLHEKIELPRNENGEIDVEAGCQMLNDIVEVWVRENPGQWQWFHRRWN